MQAVGKKNRTSLHSLYDFVLMTRGILCIGTGGPTYKRTRGLLCFGISNNLPRLFFNKISIFQDCFGPKKSFNQIKDVENSFLAIDGVEFGRGNKIPLWLFGFLY